MPAKQALVEIDGQVRAAAFAGDGREQMQRVRLVGNCPQHAPGETFRLPKLSGSVRFEGGSQPPGDPHRVRAAWRSALSPSGHAAIQAGCGAETAASGSAAAINSLNCTVFKAVRLVEWQAILTSRQTWNPTREASEDS